MDGYYLVDRARSGSENMELDQWMVERSAATGIPMIRFYQWSEPTLSLGYFQPFEERQAHQASIGLSTVRRGTGGGAILHHFDWTVSIAMPATVLQDADISQVGAASKLYDAVHEAVVWWLEQHSYAATLHSVTARQLAATNRMSGEADQVVGCSVEGGKRGCAFLCFERRSEGDVVVDGWKVMGSAQRRVQGAVLQHGSLLLKRSEYAPSLPGLADLGSFDANENAYQGFRLAILGSVAKQLSVRLTKVENEFPASVGRFERTGLFASSGWLHKR